MPCWKAIRSAADQHAEAGVRHVLLCCPALLCRLSSSGSHCLYIPCCGPCMQDAILPESLPHSSIATHAEGGTKIDP